MKELFLITSHTPDQRREDMLHNFVNKLQDYDYDIMICTHCPIPVSIANKVDYVLYEKQNRLLTNFDEKFPMWYGNDSFTIYSSEVNNFNHMVAIGRSLGLGLKTAKDMGYEKVHYFEYDTDFDSLKEIEENSELLNNHSSVYYDSPFGPNSPVSFNINKISEKWFKYDYDYLMNFVKNNHIKTIEQYETNLFAETGNYFNKPMGTLRKNGIYNALNACIDENPFNIFFTEGEFLSFFGENSSDKPINVLIVINNNIINSLVINPHAWSIQKLDLFQNINNLILILDGEIRKKYNFDDESREIFKKYNYIKHNN